MTVFMKNLGSIVIGLLSSLPMVAATSATSIDLPPHVVEGQLDNGLHYIILENDLPRHNVECRLVMRVGAIQEEANQKGAAHFLEHMATNGSTHFPGASMVDYFERQGMKYGRDINAFTGFDRTIYWFTLPMDKYSGNIVDSTIVAVGDILGSLTIDPERVKKERGIIIEELRGYDTGDPFYNLKNGHGRYAEHLPLGREIDINSMEYTTLRDFYHKWYSPEMATLVIVGNVNAQQAEQKVREYLSGIPAKKTPWVFYPHEYPKGVQMMVQSQEYGSHLKLDLMIPHQNIVTRTLEDWVKTERQRMLIQMLDHRMEGAHCFISDHWYLADKSHLSFVMESDTVSTLLDKVTLAAANLKYLATKGPGKDELAWALNQRISRIRPESLNKFSADWVENFIDEIVIGDHHLYSEKDTQAIVAQLQKTTAKQIRELAQELLVAGNRTLLAAYQCPEAGVSQMSDMLITSAWQSASAAQASAFHMPEVRVEEAEEKIAVPALLATTHPALNNIVSRQVYDELGLTEVTLNNGIHLLLRPTVDDEHKLHISAFGRGGLGDLKDHEYHHLKDAVGYVDMGGISTIDADTLSTVMLQEELMMNVGIDNYWHESLVTSAPEQAQTLMNLLYEKMHHPGKDQEDFDISKQQELESFGQETTLSLMMKQDQTRMINARVDSLFGNAVSGQFMPYTRQDVENLSLDDMTDYYTRLFSDPQGLYLLFTGNFDVDSITTMAASTFGRMTRPAQPLHLRNEAILMSKTPWSEQFPTANDTQTSCNILFAANYQPALKQTLMFKLMRDILQDRMIRILRQQDNIVYSPFADAQYHGAPQNVVWFRLYIDVKNENYDRMVSELGNILSDLGKTPVSEAELNKMKRSFTVTKRQALTDVSPAEWKNAISNVIRNGESLQDYNDYDDVLASITPEEVREAFARILNMNNMIMLYQKSNK